MKIKFPEYGRQIEHSIANCDLKFAVLKVTNEIAKKVLIIFPFRLGHKLTISNWMREHSESNPEFLGAGVTNISEEIAVWGSRSCAAPENEGGFGKEKPKNPEDAAKLLAKVREKVTELAKTLQEA